MKWLSHQLRKDMWSPEIAGVGLGITFILSLLLAKKLPGASGTVFNISAIVGRPLTAHDSTNTFFSQMFQPITDGLNWQFFMLVGLFLGALASVLLARKFQWTLVPIEQWKDVFGTSVAKRWAIAFIGGVILQIGAGIAGGCTSGLALAGGVQLSPAAFLFIPGIFISGAILQLLVYREKY
ncbi:MAG: YeeE/YedE family protein [Anaerolineae bacterium]|nr:YeeE/YedE family protein [Anaerolineae bacterium]